MRLQHTIVCAPLLLAGCTPALSGQSPSSSAVNVTAVESEQARVAAQDAIIALRAGDFEDAAQKAERVIEREPHNAPAHLVAALARYRATTHQVSLDARTVLFAGLEMGNLNQRYLRSVLAETEGELAAVEASLAVASADPALALELCLACWEIDYNQNGRIDRRDRLLLQIEQDGDGEPYAADDPRRKPTFRFDHGDVYWARAFVSFQRAAIAIVSAYEWDGVDALLARDGLPDDVVFRLARPARIAEARQLILAGLQHSDSARRAYLAETDDDREWVPNPDQKNHPLPLPMDAATYDTWEGAIGDLQRLVRGEEGLSVRELAQLDDHRSKRTPGGFIDLSQLLEHPKDIVLDPTQIERMFDAGDVEGALKHLLGGGYVPTMKPSPLIKRLQRMKGEIDRGEDSFERKLRYLFWIN
jgi:hypothetical protein